MWLLVLAAALIIAAVLLTFIMAYGPFVNVGDIITNGNRFRHYHYEPVRGPRSRATNTTLVVEFFLPTSPIRREELLFCYRHNLGLPELDKIVFLTHDAAEEAQFRELFGSPAKAILQRIEHPRATFGDLFTQGNRYVDEDGLLIVANSDIAFDSSVDLLRYLRSEEAVALTRYELTQKQPLGGVIQVPTKWSNDTWVVRGRAHQSLEQLQFTPGLLACDNVLNQSLVRLGGYKLFNPCYDVKTYHVHASNIRTYRPTDVVRQLGYLVEAVRWQPK